MPPPRPGRRRRGAVECPPRGRRRPRCAAAQSRLRGWWCTRPGAAARPTPRARRAADQVPTCARHPRHRGRDARSPATLVSEARDVPESPREPHGTLHRHWHRQGREGLGLQGCRGRHGGGAHREHDIAVEQRAVRHDAPRQRVARRVGQGLEGDAVERRVGRDHGERRIAPLPDCAERGAPPGEMRQRVGECAVGRARPREDRPRAVEDVADRIQHHQRADDDVAAARGPASYAAFHGGARSERLPDGGSRARADRPFDDVGRGGRAGAVGVVRRRPAVRLAPGRQVEVEDHRGRYDRHDAGGPHRQAARIPLSGPSTTLQPVARSRSVQCPTEIPRTAVRLAGAEDAMGARSIARLARVVEGTYVSAMPNPDPQSPPTTVLVVDDEDGIRQALDRFLTRLGYRVLQAASGAEALDRQAAEQPHVMLSDIRMPNMTGAELVPKALAADSDLAIIMLTAIDEPRTAIECLKLGAYDYLIKPVDLDELEMSLQSGLRQRQLEIDRRELEQWLAREVAVRTRDLEERTTVVEDVALTALAAAGDWPGANDAIEKLAKELGTSPDDVTREVRKRQSKS